MSTIEMSELKKYLDMSIRLWRDIRDGKKHMLKNRSINGVDERTIAMFYVDAFQSVRSSVFGELLPEEKDVDATN